MKFHIEVTAPADKGPEIDAAGGPGPVVAELMQRFRPEVMYGSADRRTLIFVADLEAELDIAILMSICASRLYAYPTMHPVVGIADLPDFVATVHDRIDRPLVAG